LNVFDYPRIHLLASGELIWTHATTFSQAQGWLPRPSPFLDLTPPFPCGEQRWKDGESSQPTTATRHFNGSSVHLITWDRATDQFTELLYVIGGATIPFDHIGSCSNPAFDPTKIHGIVERMVLNPLASPSESGEWESTPSLDLNHARVNHNAVILLDGSIVVIGGLGWNGTCAWRRWTERLMPEEVVESSSPAAWAFMALQDVPRQYHSVAGLLPDGSVVSAGGANLPQSETDWCKPDHTLEIFKPPYFFNGVRPDIDTTTLTDPAVGHYNYNATFSFSVTLETTVTVDRVALVRPGASTHAFDSSQLYVELRLPTLPSGGGTLTLQPTMPPNGNYAPPGYYLLVVVDSLGRPSAGAWIRLDEA